MGSDPLARLAPALRPFLELGVCWQTGPHWIAGPHPLIDRLRPSLEAIARELVAGDHAAIATRSGGRVGVDAIKRAVDRLRRRSGKPALPPAEAYQATGGGDARASIQLFPDRRVFCDAWTAKGRQPGLSFALRIGDDDTLLLVGLAEGSGWPEE